MSAKLLGLSASLILTVFAMMGLLGMQPGPTSFGAVGNTDFQQGYYSYAGVDYDQENIPLSGTSSIPAFVVPTYIHGVGTSTVVSMSLTITANGIGAQAIDISTSTGRFAASSSPALIASYALPNLQKWSFMWLSGATTTSRSVIGTNVLTSLSDVILAPGVGVQMKIASSSPGTFTTYDQGVLHVLFKRI